MTTFTERRAWFERYAERVEAGELPVLPHGLKYPCACCGYPTLGGIPYEICVLCGWENNGQDDPYADEVWEGSNHGYSLTQARIHFAQHGSMYASAAAAPARERATKERMIALFEQMPAASPDELDTLWREVERQVRILDEAVDRAIRARERGGKRA